MKYIIGILIIGWIWIGYDIYNAPLVDDIDMEEFKGDI